MAQSKQKTDREMLLDILHFAPGKTSAEDLLFNYKDVLYPSTICSKEMFEALETFEARDDDLMIVTYPKCGTNWVIQILHEMVSIIKNQETVLDQPMIEFGSPQMLERLKEQPSPRILSTHLNFQMIPKSFFEKKTQMLIVIRNPKDAAISFFNFYKNMPALPTYESWNLFFNDFIHGNVCYGSYFNYLVEWNNHIDEGNVMAITFEDMKTDFLTQLKKISEFFGLPLTDEQLCEVERRTSFTSMKQKSEDTHGKLGDAFFRKGQIGDWKSLFNEEQSKEVDAKFQQHLDKTKLGDLLNYAKYCKF
ncbi:PREDICTED: sulfotransferase 6B1-like [Nanorana parkeri]|uniref:sulfotransferase 6B1-like n=1 Tax=Nanorana parkeri TaxID=125878 RepID=UPI000854F89C|nr:PREDICTED: sulfotransferase 6B1-like [Nanorana parkeri]